MLTRKEREVELTEEEIDKKLKQIKKYMKMKKSQKKNENKDLEALKREMDMNNSKLVVHPGSDMIPVSDIMSRSPPSSLSSSPSSSLSSSSLSSSSSSSLSSHKILENVDVQPHPPVAPSPPR